MDRTAAPSVKTAAEPAAKIGWIWALAIALTALLAFQPALHNELPHDDRPQVAELEPPTGWRDYAAALAQPWWQPELQKNIYRPLTRVAILAQKGLFGDATGPFHLANLALHALASLLLWRLGRRLLGDGYAAGLAGLIFAAHPIHAEAVHQVVGQAELIAAVAMLAGLLTLRGRGGRDFWLQPLLLAVALGGKEHALLYPLYVAAVLAWRGAGQTNAGELSIGEGRRSRVATRSLGWGRQAGLLALLACVGLVFLLLKRVVTGGVLEGTGTVPLIENPLAPLGLVERVPAVLGIFGYALSRMVWPLGLSPDYSADSLTITLGWGWPWAWAGLVALSGLIAAGVWNRRRGGRAWLLIGAGLAAWGLTSNALFVIGTITAERLWYWPSAAACLGLGWGVAWCVARAVRQPELGRLRTALAVLLTVGLVSIAWRYAPAWRTQRSLAEATLQRFPQSWRGHVNLAGEDYAVRAFESGLAHAREATRLKPAQGLGWDWVGLNAMFLPGGAAEAEQAFRRALELEPGLYRVHQHLGNLLRMHGRNAEAAEQFEYYLPHAEPREREELVQRIRMLRDAANAR